MVSAPTRIVSRPTNTRARSRLSIASATAVAWRHSRARLSARAWSRGRSCPVKPRAPDSPGTRSTQRYLHNEQHTPAGENSEGAGPFATHRVRLDHGEDG